MKTIEVELRGPLSKTEFEKLTLFFKKHATFKGYKERVLIDYSTFLPDEGVENRKRDIRLRTTNGIPEIMIKLGSWGGSDNRKELSLIAQRGEFDKLVQIFAALGLNKGKVVLTKTNVFMYKGVEFAVVNVWDKRYIFEAEIMVKDKSSVEKARKKLESIITELGLKIYTDEEFYAYIHDLNKNNIAKTFDYSEYSDGYFKKKFHL